MSLENERGLYLGDTRIRRMITGMVAEQKKKRKEKKKRIKSGRFISYCKIWPCGRIDETGFGAASVASKRN